MRAPYIIAIFVALILPNSTYAAESEFISVDPSIQSIILAHVNPQRPKNTIVKITKHMALKMDDLFEPMRTKTQSFIDYTVLDNGLIANVDSFSSTTGNLSGISQSITLCGLIDIVSQSSSNFEKRLTSIFPLGKIFIQFGIKTNEDFAAASRIVAFETNAANLCTPTIGSEFSYRIEMENSLKTTSFLGGTKKSRSTFEYICRAGKVMQSASQLLTSLTGDSLSVTCETTPSQSNKVKFEYAYLIDSGLFLIVSQETGSVTMKMNYSDAEYSPHLQLQ